MFTKSLSLAVNTLDGDGRLYDNCKSCQQYYTAVSKVNTPIEFVDGIVEEKIGQVNLSV